MRITLATLCLALTVAGCSGTRPDLGIINGKLRPCPPSPNCITSSQEDNHAGQALYFAGDSVRAWHALTAIVRDMDNSKIVSQTGTYIHVEFTSAIFRFVDDVEFLLNPKANKIDMRSASRNGHFDFGANRKRLKKIKKLFSEQCAIAIREY